MAKLHEIQGYVLVLDKVAHVTRIFDAEKGGGAQFNIGLVGSGRIQLKFADRPQATLARDLLLQALEAL